MAIGDEQKEYTSSLLSLFQNKKEVPFQVYGFTKKEALREFYEEHDVELLLVSEAFYQENQQEQVSHVMILRESEASYAGDVVIIDKYQAAGSLYQNIMKAYGEYEDSVPTTLSLGQDFTLIGIYSPIHRCLQTTMALTMGQLLAEQKRTLYLNFECFSGLEVMMGRRFSGNLTDILYYFQCDREKMFYRLEGIVQGMNGLDIIPPAASYEDYECMKKEQWLELFREIARLGHYDVILLDLTECVQGLLQILQQCVRIYTLTKEDRMARAKLAQYELLLEKNELDEILQKTEKCSLPIFKCLPSQLDRLGRSELAAFAKNLLIEDGFYKG